MIKSLKALNNAEIIFSENYTYIRGNRTSGFCTPKFRSVNEKAEIKMYGRVDEGTEIKYVLYSYDDNEAENIVHEEDRCVVFIKNRLLQTLTVIV